MDTILDFHEKKFSCYTGPHSCKILATSWSWESFWESNTLKRSTRLLQNAEESSYMYEKQTWVPLVRLLDNNDLKRQGKEGLGLGSLLVRAKMEAFLKGFDEISQRHRGSYRFPDLDLRVQIKESTMKLVVPVYTEFLNTYLAMLRGKLYVSPEAIQGLLGQIFDGADVTLKRRDSKGWIGGGNLVSVEGDIKDFLRSRSNASNV